MRNTNFSRKMSIESADDHRLEESHEVVETPHLGAKPNYDKSIPNEMSSQSYLNKYEVSANMPTSNHLYKFNAQYLKRGEEAPIPNQLIKLPLENKQDIFIEGKNPDILMDKSKRVIQRTPLNANLQNYIESFAFETPGSTSAHKLPKFATPSSGGESLTTATSMRKNPHRITPKYSLQSPSESR